MNSHELDKIYAEINKLYNTQDYSITELLDLIDKYNKLFNELGY